MLDEFKKTLSSQLAERVTSPLGGSFVISWALWNYKFIVILFSNNTATTTFSLIERIAFPSFWATLTNGILFPLLTALAYIFIYPYPSRFIYKFTRERQREISIIRQQIEDETPLTTAESRELRRLHRQLQESHEQEIARQEALIRDLKAEIAGQLNKNIPAEPPKEADNEADRLTEQELDILSDFGDSSQTSLSELMANGRRTRVATEYTLGELAQKGYIQARGAGDTGRYKLTHKGRGVLVQRGMDLA